MTSGSRTLLTGPAGSGKTHHALERVKAAATLPGARGRAAGRPGEVLFVLPTYAQALHLARAALGWWGARAVLDDPFATFTSAGERYLEDFQVRALPSAVERDELMEEALRRAAAPRFERVRDRPGFRARLLRLVKEIKQSGRPVAEVAAELEASLSGLGPAARARLEAFLQVFAAYEALLRDARLEDHEDTLRRLLEQLEATGVRTPPQLLVVDGFDDLTPVEQRILDVLADGVVRGGGSVLVTLPWDERRPKLFAASRSFREHLLREGYREERLAGFPRSDVPVLGRLAEDLFLETDVRPHVEPDDGLEVIQAGDPEDEAEALARHARRLHDTPGLVRGWRDIGVVFRSLDEAGPRIEAAFERLGIPVRRIGTGSPLASEGYVRALEEPLRVLGGGGAAGSFHPDGIVRWLRWNARCRGGAEALDRLDRQEIEWRRSGWPGDFDGMRCAFEDADLDRLEDLRTAILGLEGASEVWSALERAIHGLALLPAMGGLDDTGRPVDPAQDERRRRAVAARDRLAAIASGLRAAAARTGIRGDVRAPEAVPALLEQVTSTRLALPDRRLDAVNVLDAEEARHWEIPIVMVAGLAEQGFPLRPTEDVLIRDADRAALREKNEALALPLARDQEVRERRLFYGALTRATRRLVLVRPAFDADGGVRPPTLFLRDVERIVPLEGRTTRRPPGRPAPERDECFTRADWRAFAAGHPGPLATALLPRLGPHLRERAARWRRSGRDPLDFARHGGRIEAALCVVSPTRIREALACPYRYFLKVVAGIPEDDAPLGGPTYGPRETGSLAHAVFERAVRYPDEEPETVVRAAIERVTKQRELPPLDPVTEELQRVELVRMVRLLRHREAAFDDGFHPVVDELERAFGGSEGLVLEGSGGRLALRGHIDRVERRGREAVVVDYKLSKSSAKSSADHCDEGLDVQLPLYALALEKLDGVEVVGLEWMAARTAYRAGRWSEDALAEARVRAELGPVTGFPSDHYRAMLTDALDRSIEALERIRAGLHLRQLDDAKRCGACDWYSVCRPSHREPAREDKA